MSRPSRSLNRPSSGPDRVVATARPPDVGRVDDRHLHLLAADPVLLLADDLLDALADPLAERQQRIDPRAELAHVAGAQEQPVRRHLGVGRVVAERGEEEVGQAHGRVRIAARSPDGCGAPARTRHAASCDRAYHRPSTPDPSRLEVPASPLEGVTFALVVVDRAGGRVRLHQRLPRHGQRDRDVGRDARAAPAPRDPHGRRRSTSSARSPGPPWPRPSARGSSTRRRRPRPSSRRRSSARSPGT